MIHYSVQDIILFLLFIHSIDAALRNRTTTLQDNEREMKRIICKGFDCPNFTLYDDYLNTDDHPIIQWRRYDSAKYISSRSSNCDYFEALNIGHMNLVPYRAGDNSANERFWMTLPLLVKVNNTKRCQRKHTILFYLPYAMQQNPPRPTDNDIVKIVNFKAMEIYTYSFHETDFSQVVDKYDEFKNWLTAEGLCYNQNFYYVGHYGPYHTPGQKFSEIWVKKKKDC